MIPSQNVYAVDTSTPQPVVALKNCHPGSSRRYYKTPIWRWLKRLREDVPLIRKKINRVLCFTDVVTCHMGIQDPNILTATSGQKAEEGISTTTLGFAHTSMKIS